MSDTARHQRHENVLEATGVTKRFGGLVAVNDVDFAVPQQVDRRDHRPQRRRQDDVLQLHDRPLQADDRQVLFDGRDITAKAPHIVTQAGVARTFQNIKLFKTMTVLENVQVGRHARMKARITGSILHTPFVRREEREVEEYAARAAQARRHPAPPPRPRRQPALRRPAPARDRARAGLGSRSCCCSTSRRPA